MNAFISRTGLLVLALGVSLSGWAAKPCMPIAMECMKEGYYKGGEKVGKGLVKDCVMPVANKTKVLPNTSFSDADLDACKMNIMEKMKNKMAGQ